MLAKCCPKPAGKQSHGAQSGGCHLLSLQMTRNERVTPELLSALFGRGDGFSLSPFLPFSFPLLTDFSIACSPFYPWVLEAGWAWPTFFAQQRSFHLCWVHRCCFHQHCVTGHCWYEMRVLEGEGEHHGEVGICFIFLNTFDFLSKNLFGRCGQLQIKSVHHVQQWNWAELRLSFCWMSLFFCGPGEQHGLEWAEPHDFWPQGLKKK